MIFGIGTDIIEVNRMEKHLEKNDALMKNYIPKLNKNTVTKVR